MRRKEVNTMDEKKYSQLQENMDAMAKAALTFYRSAQEAGATADESNRLTQAFIASISMVADRLANGNT